MNVSLHIEIYGSTLSQKWIDLKNNESFQLIFNQEALVIFTNNNGTVALKIFKKEYLFFLNGEVLSEEKTAVLSDGDLLEFQNYFMVIKKYFLGSDPKNFNHQTILLGNKIKPFPTLPILNTTLYTENLLEDSNILIKYQIFKNLCFTKLVGKFVTSQKISTYLTYEGELQDNLSNKKVVIKLLGINIKKNNYLFDGYPLGDIKRFLLIANFQYNVLHPNINRLLTSFYCKQRDDDDLCFLIHVFEYVHGKTLRDYVFNHGTLSFIKAVQIINCIGNALIFLHKKGIVYRNLNPSNIIIRQEKELNPILIGFTFAKHVEAQLTEFIRRGRTGINMPLTAQYSAPELLDDPSKCNRRSDVYSLASILFYIVTGAPPDQTNLHIPKISKKLSNILKKALANNPKERYENITLFLNDLNRAIDNQKLGQSSQAINTETLAGQTEQNNIFGSLLKKNKQSSLPLITPEDLEKSRQYIDFFVPSTKFLKNRANLPNLKNLNVSLFYKPMDILGGGDLYGFRKFSENTCAFYLGDITGHGYQCSKYVGYIEDLLHFYLASEKDCNIPTLKKISAELETVFPSTYFLALLVGIFDFEKRKLKIIRFGTELFVQYSPNSYRLNIHDPKGMLILGSPIRIKNIQEQSYEYDLNKDDIWLFFTDGLSELQTLPSQNNDRNKNLSYLYQCIRNSNAQKSNELKKYILDHYLTKDTLQDDDITLLMFQVAD